MSECETAFAEWDRVAAEIALTSEEHDNVMDRLTIDVEECKQLKEEKANYQASLTTMQARLTKLSTRVAYLEAVNRNKSTLSMSQKRNKNKLVLIQKFAKLLSPETDKKEQVSILFDELYEKRKYF